MPEVDKLKIVIDRDECIGDGACESEAPETFEMDDEDKAITKAKPGDDFDTIMAAAECCPVDCITLIDGECDKKLYPQD